MNVYRLTNQNWDLRTIREIVKQASDINLSTKTKGEAEPLVVMETLKGGKKEENQAIRDSILVQKHVHLAYVVVCQWEQTVMWLEDTDLEITVHQAIKHPQGTVLIVSGTLDKWRVALISNLTHGNDVTFRAQLRQVFNDLEQRGFSQVFSDYRRRKDDELYLT